MENIKNSTNKWIIPLSAIIIFQIFSKFLGIGFEISGIIGIFITIFTFVFFIIFIKHYDFIYLSYNKIFIIIILISLPIYLILGIIAYFDFELYIFDIIAQILNYLNILIILIISIPLVIKFINNKIIYDRKNAKSYNVTINKQENRYTEKIPFYTESSNKNDNYNNTLFISNSIIDSLPSMVKNELIKMSAQKQQEFLEEFNRKKKTISLGYVFLLFIFGFHYAYLNKWGEQIIFILTGGGLIIWWIVDLFRIPSMVKNYNKDIAINVLRNMKALYNN